MVLYMIRFGEIGIKGRNRILFEKKLESNTSAMLKRKGVSLKMRWRRGRLFAETDKEASLKNIFGIVSYSPVSVCKPELKIIKSFVKEDLINCFEDKGFRVDARRIDKDFPMTSPEIEKELGMFIEQNSSGVVRLKGYDAVLGVELHKDAAYVYTSVVKCFGGLPLGIEGRALLLFDDSTDANDCVLAGLLMMKRGCIVIPVVLDDGKADSRDVDLSLLQEFCHEDIRLEHAKGMADVERIASENKCPALVLGERISDVKDIDTKLAVFRPLVGFSDDEIKGMIEGFAGYEKKH